MEHYTDSYEVDTRSIKQDKVDLRMGPWVFTGSHSDYMLYVRNLTDPDSEYGWAFRRTNDNRLDRKYIKIREGRNTNHPLFSGIIRIQRRGTRPSDSSITAFFRPEIAINPTRCLWYQGLPEDLEAPVGQWDLPPFDLHASLSQRLYRGVRDRTREHVLDGSDNVLRGRWLAYGCPGFWPAHVSNYLEAVYEHFDRAFNDAVNGTGGSVARSGRIDFFSLKSSESYVELVPPEGRHPIDWAYDLEQYLASVAHEIVARDYEVAHMERNCLRRYSRYFRLTLSNGKQLRVYAKTNQRVRLEVYHDFEEHGEILHRRRRSSGHTTSSLSDISRWLTHQVAADTTSVLNNALRHVRCMQQRPAEGRSPYLLISKIYELCGIGYGSTILHSLAINHRIAIGRRGDSLRRYTARLMEAGVLERIDDNRHTTIFVVTQEYADALHLIASRPSRTSYHLAD